jgi:hypothetical protein
LLEESSLGLTGGCGRVDRVDRLISVILHRIDGVSSEAEDNILPKDTDDIHFSAVLHCYCGRLVAKSRTWRSIAIIKFMDKFRDLGLEILCEFSEL